MNNFIRSCSEGALHQQVKKGCTSKGRAFDFVGDNGRTTAALSLFLDSSLSLYNIELYKFFLSLKTTLFLSSTILKKCPFSCKIKSKPKSH